MGLTIGIKSRCEQQHRFSSHLDYNGLDYKKDHSYG